VKLVFLGRFRDIASSHLSDISLPGDVANLSGLRDWLTKTEPDLAQALAGARTQYAVNRTIVRDLAHPIRDSDEIAFLPPMSGG
jgi:molybdopterin converting factor small subunit